MARTSTGIQYNARTMNGIVSINADEITCSGTITSDLIKASNLLEADTPETITAQWTYNVLPQSSVVPAVANDLVNKNYVDTLGAGYVNLTGTQTISGLKTFSSNVRINTARSLLLGTSTSTGILQYNTGGVYYDITPSGTHFFFINGLPIVDIEGTGLVIRTGKNLSFFGGSSFTENTGGNAFDVNIPTGFQYNFKINSVNKLQVHPTFGTYIADDLNMTTQKYLNWGGGSFQQEDSAGSAYVYNVPSASYSHSFKFANVEKLKISSDTNGGIITFSGGIVMREYTGFQWLLYQLPASNVLKYQVAGNDIMEVASGGMTIYESLSMRDGKTIKWDEGFTEIAQIRKDKVNKYLEYEVASTYRHRFSVNNVDLMSLSDGFYGLRTNNIDIFLTRNKWLYMDTSNNGISCDLSGNMNYRALSGTGNHQFFVGANELCSIDIDGLTMGVSTLPTTYPKIFLDYTKTNYIRANGGGASFGSTEIGYGSSASLLLYGGTAGALSETINSGGFNFYRDNALIAFGLTNGATTCRLKQDTATTAFRLDAPTGYTHRMRINSTTYLQLTPSGLQITGGYFMRTGSGGAFGTSVFNNSWVFPNLTAWVDGTNIGNYMISDRRVKQNIVKARPILDRLCKLSMVEYNYIENGLFKDDGILHYGYIAQEIKAEFGEDFPNLTIGEDTDMTEDGQYIQPIRVNAEFSNLFMGAIQELNAKVEAQQKQIEAQQKIMEDQQRQIDQLLVLFSQSRI